MCSGWRCYHNALVILTGCSAADVSGIKTEYIWSQSPVVSRASPLKILRVWSNDQYSLVMQYL